MNVPNFLEEESDGKGVLQEAVPRRNPDNNEEIVYDCVMRFGVSDPEDVDRINFVIPGSADYWLNAMNNGVGGTISSEFVKTSFMFTFSNVHGRSVMSAPVEIRTGARFKVAKGRGMFQLRFRVFGLRPEVAQDLIGSIGEELSILVEPSRVVDIGDSKQVRVGDIVVAKVPEGTFVGAVMEIIDGGALVKDFTTSPIFVEIDDIINVVKLIPEHGVTFGDVLGHYQQLTLAAGKSPSWSSLITGVGEASSDGQRDVRGAWELTDAVIEYAVAAASVAAGAVH